MPYKRIDDLPDSVKHSLPKRAQKIFLEAFNSSYGSYKSKGEEIVFKIAWAAVKKVYKKNEKGKWVKK